MRKTRKPKKKSKPKIDVVLESLLNLELQVKELIKKIDQLQYSKPYFPEYPDHPPPKTWPISIPKYKDSTWDAIDNGWQ